METKQSTVLSQFPESQFTWTEESKKAALHSPAVNEVRSYALGPVGTNMIQAANKWNRVMGVEDKSSVVATDLPETALEKARAVSEDGVLAVFWTCAVFARLYKLFFQSPDTLPFFFVHEMKLDTMQLACLPDEADTLRAQIADGDLKSMQLASHVSPAPLLDPLVENGASIVDANSNAAAAEMCTRIEVDACMTTQAARERYGLTTLHAFGSPPMLFFGGITKSGLALLERARK